MKKLMLFILLNMLIISCYERKVTFKCKTNRKIFKNNYYNIIVKRKNLDESTFRCLEGGYAKDKNHVYTFPDDVLDEADPNTFEVLNLMYGRDKNQIYFSNNKLSGSDLNSFKTYNETLKTEEIYYDAEDKNNYYLAGDIVKKK